MPVKVKLVEVDGSGAVGICVKTEEGEGSAVEGRREDRRMGLVWKEWRRDGRQSRGSEEVWTWLMGGDGSMG